MKYKFLLTAFTLTSLLGLVVLIPVEALPAAATYTVNSDTDAPDNNPGDGVCATLGGNCTLSAAITEADLDGVSSVIHFASQFQGTHAIPGCSLPQLTEGNTTIDASANWDTAYDRPGVEITIPATIRSWGSFLEAVPAPVCVSPVGAIILSAAMVPTSATSS